LEFRGVLILLALIQPLCAESPPAGLIGRWRSLETSKGGIGAMFEFRADSAVQFSPGAVVEAAYRIEGTQLVLPPATTTGPEQKSTIEWLGEDRFRLKAGDQTAEELSRRGARVDARNPILGEWRGSRQMGANRVEVRWFFYPAGKALLLIPFTIQAGRYSIDRQTIRIELPNRKMEGKFDLQGDMLRLPGPRGNGESRYARY
jgi:hypothetical protein